MEHIKVYLFIAALLFISQQPALAVEESATINSAADDTTMAVTTTDNTAAMTRYILPELLIRPMGFLGTLAGAAFFVAGSPFSGLASIQEPHDAFKKTFDDFVMTPFDFTFRRPIGDYTVPLKGE